MIKLNSLIPSDNSCNSDCQKDFSSRKKALQTVNGNCNNSASDCDVGKEHYGNNWFTEGGGIKRKQSDENIRTTAENLTGYNTEKIICPPTNATWSVPAWKTDVRFDHTYSKDLPSSPFCDSDKNDPTKLSWPKFELLDLSAPDSYQFKDRVWTSVNTNIEQNGCVQKVELENVNCVKESGTNEVSTSKVLEVSAVSSESDNEWKCVVIPFEGLLGHHVVIEDPDTFWDEAKALTNTVSSVESFPILPSAIESQIQIRSRDIPRKNVAFSSTPEESSGQGSSSDLGNPLLASSPLSTSGERINSPSLLTNIKDTTPKTSVLDSSEKSAESPSQSSVQSEISKDKLLSNVISQPEPNSPLSQTRCTFTDIPIVTPPSKIFRQELTSGVPKNTQSRVTTVEYESEDGFKAVKCEDLKIWPLKELFILIDRCDDRHQCFIPDSKRSFVETSDEDVGKESSPDFASELAQRSSRLSLRRRKAKKVGRFTRHSNNYSSEDENEQDDESVTYQNCNRLFSIPETFHLHECDNRTYESDSDSNCVACKHLSPSKVSPTNKAYRSSSVVADKVMMERKQEETSGSSKPEVYSFNIVDPDANFLTVPRRIYLKVHSILDTGERLYTCEIRDVDYTLSKGDVDNATSSVKTEVEKTEDAKEDNEYSCDACGKRFPQLKHLKLHQNFFVVKKAFSCKDCHKMFMHGCHLNIHRSSGDASSCRRSKHSSAAVGQPASFSAGANECTSCGRRFIYRTSLKKHLVRCKKGGNIREDSGKNDNAEEDKGSSSCCTCNKCGTSFPTKGHMASHSCSEYSPCPSPSIPPAKKQRSSSIISVASTSAASGSGDARIAENLNSKAFFCKICDRTFGTSSALIIHQRFKHPDESTSTANEQSSLKDHPEVNPGCSTASSDDSLYQCQICDRNYKSMRSFLKHHQSHYGNINQRSIRTKQQDESPTTTEKKTTSLENTNNGRFECEICGNSYTAKSTLVAHMRFHEQKCTSHQCTKCHIYFVSSDKLRRHIPHCKIRQIHIKAPVETCDLKEMVKSKSEKPNQDKSSASVGRPGNRNDCPLCLKQFTRGSALTLHFRMSHRGVPLESRNNFSCTFCSHVFSYENTLSRHIERRHRREVSQRRLNTPASSGSIVPASPSSSSVASPMSPPGKKQCRRVIAESPGEASSRRSTVSPAVKRYRCSVCHKVFGSMSTLFFHRKNHRTSPEVKDIAKECESNIVETVNDCNSDLTNFSSVEKTKKPKSSVSVKKYKCEFCGKWYAGKHNLNFHVKQCQADGKTSENTVDKHCDSGISKSARLKFRCGNCNSSFRNKNGFDLHVCDVTNTDDQDDNDSLVSTSSRPAQEMITENSGKRDEVMQEGISLGENGIIENGGDVGVGSDVFESDPIVCSECGDVFLSADELSNHTMVYETPFKCGLCNSEFQQLCGLKMHISSQNGYYECNKVSSEFAQQFRTGQRVVEDDTSGIADSQVSVMNSHTVDLSIVKVEPPSEMGYDEV